MILSLNLNRRFSPASKSTNTTHVWKSPKSPFVLFLNLKNGDAFGTLHKYDFRPCIGHSSKLVFVPLSSKTLASLQRLKTMKVRMITSVNGKAYERNNENRCLKDAMVQLRG